MKTKRRLFRYLRACLVLTLLSALICHADDRARDRASLRGIKTIVVKVPPFEPEWTSELAKVSLTEAVLQATVERQLEKSGIKVIPEEASERPETEGILNVRIKFLDPEPPKKTFTTLTEDKTERFDPKARLVYAIRLTLRQPVSLKRNPDVTAYAITWQTESVGFRRLALIKEDFENVVNVFIEAYLSENPDPG
jgi:hypothetical protein